MSDPNPQSQSISNENKTGTFANQLEALDTNAEVNDTDDAAESIVTDADDSDNNEESDEVDPSDEETEETDGTESIDELDDAIHLPVDMKKVYAKYPDLKKDFPDLIRANFREKEYSEVFPTVDDAKEALEKVQTLDKLTGAYFEGNTDQVLAIVKNEDPKAWAKVVNNYLPNLERVDKAAYTHVAGQVFRQAANLAYAQAQQHGNEDLMKAVQIMYQWAFGNQTPSNSYGNGQQQNTEADSVKKEREEFETTRHNSHIEDNMRLIGNSIKAQIDKNIDPNGRMTPFVKRKAVDEAYSMIMDSMKNDKRFNTLVSKGWDKAKEAKYGSESINNVKKMYYGRARELYQSVITKVRTEALKGSASSGNKNDDKPKKMKATDTASNKNTNGRNNQQGQFARGMSTLDKLTALDK